MLASGGELVVSAQGRLWRWRDHKVNARLPGFDDGARLFTSSAQGDKLAAGTDAGKLHVWTLGSMAHQVFEQGGPVEAIAFSPDGASLAAASRGRLVRIWDLTGHNKHRVFEHPGEVETIAFHPSGQTLATAGADGRVRLWSTYWDYTAAPVVLDGIAGGGRANSLKFSADGSFLIAAGFEPIARLWPLAALNPGVQLLRGSQYGSYEAMAAGNAPLRVAAVTRVAAPDVWTLDQPDAAPVAMAQGFNNASQVALSADGRWIATAGVGTRPQLWQLAAPQLAPRVLLAGAAEHNKVLFSPDSALIAGLQQDGSILLESTANATTAPRTLSPASAQPAVDFAFDPGGGRVAAVYQDGSAYLWTLRDAQRTPLAGASDKREASSIAFSHDGQHVAIAGAGFIDWQALAGQSVRRLDAPAGRLLTKIAMAATGSLLAAGTRDGTTLLWDTAAGGPPRELPGHVHAVIDLAFTADGRSLAALTPESIRLWSLHDLAAPPLRLDG